MAAAMPRAPAERLAVGRALADDAFTRTVAAMYDAGSLLYPLEDDWLDRRDEARREREDTWREEQHR